MLKKIIPVMLAVIALSFSAFGAYDDSDFVGFDPLDGNLTETTNEYFFYPDLAVSVTNQEVDTDPYYQSMHAGTVIYMPIYVYSEGSGTEAHATEKMIKNDNVTISSKVLTGKNYVGDIELVDGKKLKLKGISAGAYVKIPLTADYSKSGRSMIHARFVLSVNDVTYEDTQVMLKCNIRNRETEINKNTVYGAKTPAQFHVDKPYSGEATFDFGNNVKYTAKVKAGKTYYLNLSKEPDSAIKAMYPDAHLEFYNFLGDMDTFQSTGVLEIPIDRAKLSKDDEAPSLYAYRIDGNNLTALGAGTVAFNPRTDKLALNTKTLESYVLSNTPLLKTIAANQNDNILKTGYATIADPSTSELPASSAASSTAASSQAASSAPAVLSYDEEDGYVPEESEEDSFYNPSMGLAINAANISSDNPSTSDSTMLAAAFAGLACGLTALICLRKKR